MLGAFLALLAGLAAATSEAAHDDVSLLQISRVVRHVSPAHRGQQDLAFVHVPMNFGNSIALTAAVGSGSTLLYGQVSGAAQQGWSAVSPMLRSGAPVWGPMNPDLQVTSELGYPMYYTPQSLWPKDLAERYFGNKTVFGLLRDPHERLVAYFRGQFGTARGWQFTPDGRVCAGELNSFVKAKLAPLVRDPSQVPEVNLHVQADYFEGPHAITAPLDLDAFPLSANALLQAHGYGVEIRADDMIHVHGCDETWAGDLDAEARGLIQQYYARDFALRCAHFGYCDASQDHCLQHVPGMCPSKAFAWDDGAGAYQRHPPNQ